MTVSIDAASGAVFPLPQAFEEGSTWDEGDELGTCPWSWVSVMADSRSLPNIQRSVGIFTWALTVLPSCTRNLVSMPSA